MLVFKAVSFIVIILVHSVLLKSNNNKNITTKFSHSKSHKIPKLFVNTIHIFNFLIIIILNVMTPTMCFVLFTGIVTHILYIYYVCKVDMFVSLVNFFHCFVCVFCCNTVYYRNLGHIWTKSHIYFVYNLYIWSLSLNKKNSTTYRVLS